MDASHWFVVFSFIYFLYSFYTSKLVSFHQYEIMQNRETKLIQPIDLYIRTPLFCCERERERIQKKILKEGDRWQWLTTTMSGMENTRGWGCEGGEWELFGWVWGVWKFELCKVWNGKTDLTFFYFKAILTVYQ